MKKIFTCLFTLVFTYTSFAQICTTSGFNVCDPSIAISSDFRNAVQLSGTGSPLAPGSKYKFSNAIPSLGLDAVVSIDAIVNATMTSSGNTSIDDDGITNESGIAGSGAALFSPRIAPDQKLSCTNRSGYVEFTIKLYTHAYGTAAPVAGTEMAIVNLNFLNFDIDGSAVGNNGWLKETGFIKSDGMDPMNYTAPGSLLTNGGYSNGWQLTYGNAAERTGLASCNEAVERSVYIRRVTEISFRLGYDYKAPNANCVTTSIQPVRDYGVRLGCFDLPAAGPLPVSLVNFAAAYNAGKAIVTWTSLQEHNLDSYEIQRSVDGVNFEVAGNVKANNLTSTQLYSFTDNIAAINSKYVYYRIRISDLDHSMKLTNTVIIKVAGPKGNEMIISPNPSGTNAQIKIVATNAGAADIVVFDGLGKIVLRQQAILLVGANSIAVHNITSLSKGYYTVRLISNNETLSSKLLISK
jgi:hypothetical protein